MIVRILGEGQFEVAESELDSLNQLDGAVESAVENSDERAFAPAQIALLDAVRTQGTRLEDDSLEDVSAPQGGDDIARELDSMSSQADVEIELARLKAGSQPEAIEPAEDGGDILRAEPQKNTTEGGAQ